MAEFRDPGGGGVSPEAFRHTMSHVAAGVVVVTAHRLGIAHAMTATAFCSVSLEPPLVLVSVARTSRFHATITTTTTWAASVLRDDQAEIARHFSRPGRDLATQFDSVANLPAPVSGAPLVAGSLVWMDCRTTAVHEAGDHTIVVGLVVATGMNAGTNAGTDAGQGGGTGPVQTPQPLTYYRSQYRS